VPLNAGRCGSIVISCANTGNASNTNSKRIMSVLSQPQKIRDSQLNYR
jgi:hypothetical protein